MYLIPLTISHLWAWCKKRRDVLFTAHLMHLFGDLPGSGMGQPEAFLVHMHFPCVWNEFWRPAQERGGRYHVTTFVRLCEDGGRCSCAVLGRRGVGARPSPRCRSWGGAVLPPPGGGRPRPPESCAQRGRGGLGSRGRLPHPGAAVRKVWARGAQAHQWWLRLWRALGEGICAVSSVPGGPPPPTLTYPVPVPSLLCWSGLGRGRTQVCAASGL